MRKMFAMFAYGFAPIGIHRVRRCRTIGCADSSHVSWIGLAVHLPRQRRKLAWGADQEKHIALGEYFFTILGYPILLNLVRFRQ
jgi:hypothetical protein